MPRPRPPERAREYVELHGFVDYVATNVLGVNPADRIHPTNVIAEQVTVSGKSKALQGLRLATNDLVEMLKREDPDAVSRLDVALAEAGRLTLSEARRRYASSYKRIVERERISSETEYYLVAGVLADQSSSATEAERALLERLASAYLGDA